MKIYSATRIDWQELYDNLFEYREFRTWESENYLYNAFVNMATGVIQKKTIYVNALSFETREEIINDVAQKCFTNVVPNIDFLKYKGEIVAIYKYIENGIWRSVRDRYVVEKRSEDKKEKALGFLEYVLDYTKIPDRTLEDKEYLKRIHRLAMVKAKAVLGNKYTILLNYIDDSGLHDVLLDPKIFVRTFTFTEHVTYKICAVYRKCVKVSINEDRVSRGMKEIDDS